MMCDGVHAISELLNISTRETDLLQCHAWVPEVPGLCVELLLPGEDLSPELLEGGDQLLPLPLQGPLTLPHHLLCQLKTKFLFHFFVKLLYKVNNKHFVPNYVEF
jgi:hypothetical protein